MDVVRGAVKNIAATNSLIEDLKEILEDEKGTLYLGYPLLAQGEEKTSLDALLMSEKYGLVAFSFEGEDIKNVQDKIYFNLEYTLMKYDILRRGRRLAVTPIVISYINKMKNNLSSDYIIANSESIAKAIEVNSNPIQKDLYAKMVESLQKIASIKPKKRRSNVNRKNSLGAKIKKIEKEVANLDQWQKKAAFEMVEGIQRIRGLAGSGKTVVLALKAAYLHFQHPEWDIAVTFYTRSLGQQFKEMINNFYREYTDEDFDEEKLHILHAWGTSSERGIYSEICSELEIVPVTYQNAQIRYGRKNAFAGIVNELLPLVDREMKVKKYDVILIDEAQDMPANFFKLCYKTVKSPKRIVYAYDELQNLSDEQMPTLKEMFDEEVELENIEGKPRRDIVLPICYRNSKWALTIAHALGFGIYRNGGGDLVQFFNDLSLWKDIGYEKNSGTLEPGKKVTLKRAKESSPEYFDELMSAEEAVSFHDAFGTRGEQYAWIAESIRKNIDEDELDADDILVIFPNAFTAKKDYFELRNYFLNRNISSNLAGVTTNRDIFKSKGIVTCSSIYRAKGNEAPMVYVIDSDFCSEGSELIKLRNILFTAITRSRGWVRVCGVGSGMKKIYEEASLCIRNEYSLDFKVPTNEEIKHMRKVHRELSDEEKRLQRKGDESVSTLEYLNNQQGLSENTIRKLKELVMHWENKNEKEQE